MRKVFVSLLCVVFVWVQVVPAQAGHWHRYPKHHHGHQHHVDGKALGIGLGILGFWGLLVTLNNALSQGTKRAAIAEEHRTRREQIWANTVTAAPGALRGSGSAEYHSSNGFARISANVGNGYVPFRGDYDAFESRPRRKRCTKEQLKRNRVPWGTSGWLYDVERGERCYYDLR